MKHLLLLPAPARCRSAARDAVKPAPTPAGAKAFLTTANETTLRLGTQQGQAGWVQQTFITDDSEAIAARANLAYNEAGGATPVILDYFAPLSTWLDEQLAGKQVGWGG